jgi:DNA-directed RNA polymerase subunit RPC12/RpoP
MDIESHQWHQFGTIHPRSYICGYCGNNVASNIGYFHANQISIIYICSLCGIPTFFNGSNQYPGPQLGRQIENLPTDISEIYNEIRNSVKNSLYTSALLLGRKLIMHLAVNVTDAKEGESFVEYVDHLRTSHYIPPNGDKLLDYIKKLGNEKNHEIKVGSAEEAQKVLKFIEALLIFIYEFPAEFEENNP